MTQAPASFFQVDRREFQEGSATQKGYMPGFGNDFETEALPGALPAGQNSPQRCAYGLYAEQLSGSPFTAPRGTNERSWLYRIRPSVRHGTHFHEIAVPYWRTAIELRSADAPFGQYRWDPIPVPEEKTTFLMGMRTMTIAGDAGTHSGMGANVFVTNHAMDDEVLCNADAEMLVVAQEGDLHIFTELGHMDIAPGEVAVIPRGMTAKYAPTSGTARGYVCENYGAKLTLPDRGPIGANCLANPRDFKTPVAAFEDRDDPHRLVTKWGGRFFESKIDWSPLDVVAWHGNYVPYKYNLHTYAPVGAILFDHPDPSIYTVMTSPSETAGTANIDFVVFPERWSVAEGSFRPPWYHRNIMSEFMGNIYGQYDAKPEGFVPGGMSLHNCMLPHGPDAQAYTQASTAELKPHRMRDAMAFMFETRFPQHPTEFAYKEAPPQADYADCWAGLRKRFNGTPEGDWSS